MRRRDISGQRFGHLVAIEDDGGPPIWRSRPWICRCDCGRTKVVPYSALASGRVISCGHALRAAWGCASGKSRLLRLEVDDDVLQEEVRSDLAAEFGEMRWPAPKGPVFHQTLSSDFELGREVPT